MILTDLRLGMSASLPEADADERQRDGRSEGRPDYDDPSVAGSFNQSSQRCQDRLGAQEIRRLQAFREAAVNRCQNLPCFGQSLPVDVEPSHA